MKKGMKRKKTYCRNSEGLRRRNTISVMRHREKKNGAGVRKYPSKANTEIKMKSKQPQKTDETGYDINRKELDLPGIIA